MAETSLQRVTIDRPFTDGYVSDLPVEQLGPRMAARLENMVFPRGVAERRRGWTYADGGAAIATSDWAPCGVVSVVFARASASRRMASLASTITPSVKVVDHTGSGLAVMDTSAVSLPRAMYRDEILWCQQDGISPLLRYGGTPAFSLQSTAGNFTSGERRVTGMSSLPSGFGVGGFFNMFGSVVTVGGTRVIYGPKLSIRLTGGVAGGTQFVVDRLLWTATGSVTGIGLLETTSQGVAAPCVDVYSTGTVTAPAANSSSTVTGAGTTWNTPVKENAYMYWGAVAADGMVITDPATGVARMYSLWSVDSDTSITLNSGNEGYSSPSSYKMLRRMPFKDVAVFRGCLFGTGVKQAASRLYYCPPGHDIGLPPKYADGRDIKPLTEILQTQDVEKDFEIPWVDIPTSLDGDPIVALLPTDSALFVVKRAAVYRVTGDYPYWRADKAGDACGCLDIRSAITDETGVYWAGDTGIWTVRGGVPYNLAGGPSRPGILTEWRNLMSEGITGPTSATSTSFITCGVAEGHLIVSVKTASPGTERCFVMDLKEQRWCGRFTRVLPTAVWSSRVPGETDRLYGMQVANPRRIIDLSPMFRSGLGTAADGDAGLAPAVAHTGSSFFTGGTLEREHRLVDVDVAAKFSSLSTPTGAVDVKVAYGDAVDVAADNTVTAGAIPSNIAGVVRRYEFRPGTRGRRQQLRIEQTVVDTDETAFEVHEIGGYVRPFGGRR